MELASRDAELKAALFRLVDVTPATRSLDDLARHLTEYLEDVDERPPSLDVAMRMGGNAPGRRALGAAAAAGVRHMAHRFIVGATPKDAVPVLRGLWTTALRRRSTCSARPPSPRRRPIAMPRAVRMRWK